MIGISFLDWLFDRDRERPVSPGAGAGPARRRCPECSLLERQADCLTDALAAACGAEAGATYAAAVLGGEVRRLEAERDALRRELIMERMRVRELSGRAPAEVRTYDHPEANGRSPQPGEQEWVFSFHAEGGETVAVRMGERVWKGHSQHVLDMLTESPCYNDGSLAEPAAPAPGLNAEQWAILAHTISRAPGGRYCGSGKEMLALVRAGLMEPLGEFAGNPYFGITPKGRAALRESKRS